MEQITTADVIKIVIVAVIWIIAVAWLSARFPGWGPPWVPQRIKNAWWFKAAGTVVLLLWLYSVTFMHENP